MTLAQLDRLPARFAGAPTYDRFLDDTVVNHDLWLAIDRQVAIPAEMAARAAAAPRVAHILVLAGDWCGDAVNILPWIGRLAGALPGTDLRVLDRDQNPDLMDAHRTGTSRSIPVFILYDADFREIGWWGPRPAALQEWVTAHGLHLSKDERYLEVRKWYARDKGRAILGEFVGLMERLSVPA